MKAIINGKIILKDRVVEGKALLYSNVIEGVVSVENIPADARHEDNFYYNMQGMRVLRPSKGLYIRNGKKVVVK